MLATVRLVNAVFYAHHGVMQEEHRIGGRYEVDVAMDLDVDEAAQSDELSQTVDYERVYAFIRTPSAASSATTAVRRAPRRSPRLAPSPT